MNLHADTGRFGAVKGAKSGPAAGGDAPLIFPGLVDLQVNGWEGVDFNAPGLSVEDVLLVAEKLAATGTVAFLPTVVTNDPAVMQEAIRTIAAAARSEADKKLTATAKAGNPPASSSRAEIVGIHLEGPFISPQQGPRGAHDPRWILAPDMALAERLCEAAGGLQVMLTLAPELPRAIDLVRWCQSRGVIAAIGHTAADAATITRAVDAGAVISTHLGNGCAGLLPRHPNPIWDQLAEDRLAATMIADGFHLPDSVLRVFLRAKGRGLMLVSDATAFSGMPPGRYRAKIGGEVILEPGGRLSVADRPGTLAGATRSLLAGVLHLSDAGLLALPEAWELASLRPAIFMGMKPPYREVLFDPVARRVLGIIEPGGQI